MYKINDKFQIDDNIKSIRGCVKVVESLADGTIIDEYKRDNVVLTSLKKIITEMVFLGNKSESRTVLGYQLGNGGLAENQSVSEPGKNTKTPSATDEKLDSPIFFRKHDTTMNLTTDTHDFIVPDNRNKYANFTLLEPQGNVGVLPYKLFSDAPYVTVDGEDVTISYPFVISDIDGVRLGVQGDPNPLPSFSEIGLVAGIMSKDVDSHGFAMITDPTLITRLTLPISWMDRIYTYTYEISF